MGYVRAAADNGSGDGEDSAALVAVVHDEAAAVPGDECPYGKGDAAAADGDALGEPLSEPESRGLVERGGEPRHGARLRRKRVHHAHGRDGHGARARTAPGSGARGR